MAWSTRAPEHRSFVATLAGCGLLLAAGIAAGLYGHGRPVFKVDYATASRAFLERCTEDGQIVDSATDRYFALFADHYLMVDLGVGQILSALALASIALVLRNRSEADGTWLRTPERRWTYVWVGTGALLWYFGSVEHSFMTDFERKYFPTCADSMGIPLFETAVAAVTAIPIAIAVGCLVTRGFGEIPARLDRWDATRPTRSWIVTIGSVLMMACVGALLALSLPNSMSVSAPAWIVSLYLLAATRAALLSPKRRDAA